MRGQGALFSNKSDNWATPTEMYEFYMSEGYFDPCPLNWNGDIFTNGLLIYWKEKVFVNPPYSNIRAWLEKALLELEYSITEEVVFLIPARTDTRYFHDLIYNKPYAEIQFIKGRLKFGDSKNSAPFPSMIVTFRKKKVL